MLKVLTCVAGLALVGTAIPAIAAKAAPISKAIGQVQTQDLDLSSESGRTALNARMERAARNVCAIDAHGQVMSRAEERTCRSKTVAALQAHFAKA